MRDLRRGVAGSRCVVTSTTVTLRQDFVRGARDEKEHRRPAKRRVAQNARRIMMSAPIGPAHVERNGPCDTGALKCPWGKRELPCDALSVKRSWPQAWLPTCL